MFSIRQLLSEMTKTLHDSGFSNPDRQAEDLLSDLLNCSRAQLYGDSQRLLTQQEWQTSQIWMDQRLQGKPLAYISGKIEFYGCALEINPSVLIPRQETEILVDLIVAELKKVDLRGKTLWDLCCGSGCIGIALKKALPALSVNLADCSEEAIELAARNAKKNDAEVICLKGDLFAPFLGQKSDYVVCNPPYISESEYTLLDQEVKAYEPRLALVAGKTGFEFYERLASELPCYLNSPGQAWLEIGYQQGLGVQELFQNPPWKKSEVKNDWAGHHRFFFLEIE